MRILCLFVALATVYSPLVPAQTIAGDTESIKSKKAGAGVQALAERAVKAHGGEKFRKMATLVVSGSVNVTVSSFQQAFPATFSTVFSGEKYLIEIDSEFASFRQAFDGTRTYTNPERGFALPPISRIGFAVLQRVGMPGFHLSELEDAKKYGFRVTSPEGFSTDLFLNKKTFLVKGYRATYVVDGREVTTLVEIRKYRDGDEIKIPSKYDQRFDLGQMTVYAAFRAKEILINSEVPDELFGEPE